MVQNPKTEVRDELQGEEGFDLLRSWNNGNYFKMDVFLLDQCFNDRWQGDPVFPVNMDPQSLANRCFDGCDHFICCLFIFGFG